MPAKRVRLSVRRSRCKRLLREAYKAAAEHLKGNYDLVFIVQKDISTSKLENVLNEVKGLYLKGKIKR